MTRHFLDISRLPAEDLRAILDDAHARKAARKGKPRGWVDADAPARDHVLAMIFEKNSTRTRFSFDAAIRQLGGSSIIATASDMQLGRGEPVELTHPGRYVGSHRHGPHRAHRRCDDAEIGLWDNGVWGAPPRTSSGPRTADPPLT